MGVHASCDAEAQDCAMAREVRGTAAQAGAEERVGVTSKSSEPEIATRTKLFSNMLGLCGLHDEVDNLLCVTLSKNRLRTTTRMAHVRVIA